MLNNLTIGKYYPVNSKIHDLNPTFKIIATLLFVISVFLTNNLYMHIILFAFLLLIISASNVPLKAYFKTIYSVKWLLLFILLINLVFKVSLTTSIVMVLRIIYILWYTTVLTLTTTPMDLTYGLQKTLSPLKKIIPVNRIAFSLALALRFIPTIFDEANIVLKSQANRGIDYKYINLKGKLLAISSLIIPVFNLTLQKADLLSDTLEVRLYDIDSERKYSNYNAVGVFDMLYLISHIIIIILIIINGVLK
ncbi:energy-coupling factor transporter transmembrane protein EcfT [Acholeplasma sp. CAG:878]|nr:energy-coupling factor transporter transmembrane protein EcfT [Acholeplasma sp. CAG:878]